MINLREIFTTGVIASSIRLVAAGMNFALNIVIARLTDLDITGYYFLLLTFISGWSLLSIFGLNIYTLRTISSLSEKRNEARKTVFHFVYRAALLSSIASLIIFFISYTLINHYFFNTVLDLYLYSISGLCVVIFGFLTLNVSAIKGWGGSVYGIVFQNLIQPVIFILLIGLFYSKNNLFELIIFYFLSISIAYVLSFYFIRKNYTSYFDLNFNNYFNESTKLLKRSMPLMPLAIFPFLMLWADTFVVGLLLTPEDVAVYNIAARISFLLLFVLAGFEVIIAPRMNQHRVYYPKTFNLFFIKISTMIFFIMLFLTVIMISLSEILLNAFGEHYLQANMTLQILIWAQFTKVLGFTSAYYMISLKKHNLLNSFQLLALLINILLNFILIDIYGVEGAAYATLASSLLLIIFQVIIAVQSMYLKRVMV